MADSSRRFEIDCVKFFAIVYMICVHIYEQFGCYDWYNNLPTTIFGNFIEFAGGPLAAPVFMFSMGIGMVYTRHSMDIDFAKRGVKLLVMAYTFNFFRHTSLLILARFFGIHFTLDEIIDSFLLVDILQFAGMAFLATALMKRCKINKWEMLGVAIVLQAAGIWAEKFTIKSVVAQDIPGLLLPTGEDVAFPLTLWLVYPVSGMIFGELLKKTSDLKNLYKKLLCGAILIFMCLTSALCYMGFDIRKIYALADNSYYYPNLVYSLWILCTILCVISISYLFLGGLKSKKAGELIIYCSQNLTKIYIIQWILIAYFESFVTVVYEHIALPAMSIICLAVVVMFCSVVISLIYNRILNSVAMRKNKM